jgi:hypothetical protein
MGGNSQTNAVPRKRTVEQILAGLLLGAVGAYFGGFSAGVTALAIYLAAGSDYFGPAGDVIFIAAVLGAIVGAGIGWALPPWIVDRRARPRTRAAVLTLLGGPVALFVAVQYYIHEDLMPKAELMGMTQTQVRAKYGEPAHFFADDPNDAQGDDLWIYGKRCATYGVTFVGGIVVDVSRGGGH